MSHELFSLKNKTALITGAAGHLGSSMAQCLGQAGAHVILNGRDHQKLNKLQIQLQRQGIETTILAFDITDSKQVQAQIAYLTQHFTALDILVNNAHAGRACTLEEADSADFLRDYTVNVIASFELIKAARPLLKKAVACQQDASIINIASMYGSVSPDPRIYGDSKMNNPPFYGAAKGGLLQLTRYLACHLAMDKIRVNAISPGPFPPQSALDGNPDFTANLIAKVPLGRVGVATELNGPLLFLASAASSFVTGINLPVDGGWTAW